MTDKQVQQTEEPVYYMHYETGEVDTEEFWRDNCEEWESFDEYVKDGIFIEVVRVEGGWFVEK